MYRGSCFVNKNNTKNPAENKHANRIPTSENNEEHTQKPLINKLFKWREALGGRFIFDQSAKYRAADTTPKHHATTRQNNPQGQA